MKALNRRFPKLLTAGVVFGMMFLSSILIAGDPAADRIFLSVPANSTTFCSSGTGCIMSFDVSTTAPVWGTSRTPAATLGAASGTSGVIIDNTVSASPTGASQVYFSTQANQACVGNGSTGSGTGGCAVQASQAGLL